VTFIAKPKFHHPALEPNALGFIHRDYEGAMSTLCAGCGHDAISAAIVHACYELSLPPHRIAKLSGIGCSSKTPTYMLGQSHGFNSVHGRMPSVLTGASLANRDLIYLGISGDGDTASIGLGQFAHAMRRGVDMVYICENNGVYGLTKGQFSATSDSGSKSKKGVENKDTPIDLVALAIELGATFAARSFSGDRKQLIPLIKAAFEHHGAAFIDVISPCVTFNNHEGSTKSFDYVREHNLALNSLDFITPRDQIEIAAAPGSTELVRMHDGSTITLKQLDDTHDVHDKAEALATLQRHHSDGRFITGLVYLDPESVTLHDRLGTAKQPLNAMSETELCPGSKALEAINAALR
jgi:2-oxoglutarate ferredoxin oxidoreductase subunit beta